MKDITRMDTHLNTYESLTSLSTLNYNHGVALDVIESPETHHTGWRKIYNSTLIGSLFSLNLVTKSLQITHIFIGNTNLDHQFNFFLKLT